MSAPGIFAGPLPDFDRPPVIEVAVGLEFLPLDALTTVELVRLHDRWSDEFPEIRLQPELPSASQLASQLPMVFGTGLPPARLWSLTDDENLLIQVQADRLFSNWRHTADTDAPYPRYAVLKGQLDRRWEQLKTHLADLSAPAPQLTVAEVTYVNFIPLAEGVDASDVLTMLRPDFHSWPARGVRLQREFPVPEESGHTGSLVINATSDNPRDLRLDVVTRISLTEGSAPASVDESLQFAHEVGVRSFAAATTDEMHKHWGRRA